MYDTEEIKDFLKRVRENDNRRKMSPLRMLIENILHAYNRQDWFFVNRLQSGRKGWMDNSRKRRE